MMDKENQSTRGRTLAFVCSSPEADPQSAHIACLVFDEVSGVFEVLARTPHPHNPTFLAIDASRHLLFVVSESEDSTVTSYKIRSNGHLDHISTQSTRGKQAAHVALDLTGDIIFVANYSIEPQEPDMAGVVAYHVNQSGELSDPFWSASYQGSGPVASRQDSTHPHSTLVAPSGRMIVVSDLGTDRLMCYEFDSKYRTIVPSARPAVPLPSGSGPRHAHFSTDGRFLYVVDELASAISVIDVKNGMTILETVSILPTDFDGYNISADIHLTLEGTLLLASNRGHNSIASLRVDRVSGRLSDLRHIPTGGNWPRNFTISPSGFHCVVANQRSHELVVLALDHSGNLFETGKRFAIAQPMCIVFARFGIDI